MTCSLHDMRTRTTSRVSVTSDGGQANSDSSRPAISADGRYVVFHSLADNLVPGDTNGEAEKFQGSDVFVHDMHTGATRRVSVANDGSQANGGSQRASISGDGGQVAFDSVASNLVAGDTKGTVDVFVRIVR